MSVKLTPQFIFYRWNKAELQQNGDNLLFRLNPGGQFHQIDPKSYNVFQQANKNESQQNVLTFLAQLVKFLTS